MIRKIRISPGCAIKTSATASQAGLSENLADASATLDTPVFNPARWRSIQIEILTVFNEIVYT